MKPATLTPLWVLAIRALLGVIFLSAGISKLVPFPSIIGPEWLVERLEPYGLGLYARFIAASEAAVGLMLLIPRLATLGAILMVPMQSSILIVTISLEWRGTPYVNSFLLLLNVALLAHDYPRWRPLLVEPREAQLGASAVASSRRLELLWMIALALVLASAILVPRRVALVYLLALCVVVTVGLRVVERLWNSRAQASSS